MSYSACTLPHIFRALPHAALDYVHACAPLLRRVKWLVSGVCVSLEAPEVTAVQVAGMTRTFFALRRCERAVPLCPRR